MDGANEWEENPNASEKNIPSENAEICRKRKREDSIDSDSQSFSLKGSPAKSESSVCSIKSSPTKSESSQGSTGSEVKTIVISATESESSSTERSGSESPVNVSEKEGDIPDNTCYWTELSCFSKLRVSVAPNVYDPKEIVHDFLCPLDKFSFSRLLVRRAETEEQKAKLSFFKEALTELMDLNYEEVTQIPLEKLQKLHLKVEISMKETYEKLHRIVKHQTGTAVHTRLALHDELLIRLEIMKPIQHFICQLIYMIRMTMKNAENKKYRVPEAMFQELFIRFIAIFQLEAFCEENMEDYTLVVGGKKVSSRPDGLICHKTCDTKAVIAVIEVKREYSKYEDEASERTLRSKEKKYTQVFHIDNKLKGQHVGEMLAVLPDSMFDEKGILGFTVQGTEVTVASLSPDGKYLSHLKKGTFPVKNYKGVSVKYSSKHNILTIAGREALLETLFLMALLHDVCDVGVSSLDMTTV